MDAKLAIKELDAKLAIKELDAKLALKELDAKLAISKFMPARLRRATNKTKQKLTWSEVERIHRNQAKESAINQELFKFYLGGQSLNYFCVRYCSLAIL